MFGEREDGSGDEWFIEIRVERVSNLCESKCYWGIVDLAIVCKLNCFYFFLFVHVHVGKRMLSGILDLKGLNTPHVFYFRGNK